MGLVDKLSTDPFEISLRSHKVSNPRFQEV